MPSIWLMQTGSKKTVTILQENKPLDHLTWCQTIFFYSDYFLLRLKFYLVTWIYSIHPLQMLLGIHPLLCLYYVNWETNKAQRSALGKCTNNYHFQLVAHNQWTNRCSLKKRTKGKKSCSVTDTIIFALTSKVSSISTISKINFLIKNTVKTIRSRYTILTYLLRCKVVWKKLDLHFLFVGTLCRWGDISPASIIINRYILSSIVNIKKAINLFFCIYLRYVGNYSQKICIYKKKLYGPFLWMRFNCLEESHYEETVYF